MASTQLVLTVDVTSAAALGLRIAEALTDAIKEARAGSANDETLAQLAASAVLGEVLRATPSSSAVAEAERDRAYRERAHLVAHLASLYPSHIGYTDPSSPDWAVVIVEGPTGQMSWHIAPGDMELFEHVDGAYADSQAWDGHTTEQKYERLQQLTIRPSKGL